MYFDLTGKCALVTGGSRGIGREIALALAREGATVAACYQQESESVASLAAELEDSQTGSFILQVDVSDETSVAHMVEQVSQRFEHLDILVNNAGVVSHTPLAAMETAEWRRVIDTNLTSMYLVTHAALNLIPNGGSIINVTSALATVGMPGRTHYTASKAGVIGFTRSLCKELGPRFIRVNAVAPGIIDTHQAAGLTPEQRARYASMASLGRLGLPADVAGVALFLASDLAGFVSGVTITVDGGI